MAEEKKPAAKAAAKPAAKTTAAKPAAAKAAPKAAAAKAAPQSSSSTASSASAPSQAKSSETAIAQPKAATKSAQKLSYKEQRELDALPALIEALEKEQTDIRNALADSSLFAKDPAKAAALFARDAQIDNELVSALERWEILS